MKAMKKIYSKPELMIVTIKPMQFIATSPGYETNSATLPNTVTSGNYGKQGFGDWDDDEEPSEDY